MFLDGCDHCCCVVLLLSPSLKPRIIGRCSLFFSLCQRKQNSASSGRRGRGLKLNKESNFSSSPPTGRRSERRFRGFSSKRLVGFPSPFLVFFLIFDPRFVVASLARVTVPALRWSGDFHFSKMSSISSAFGVWTAFVV